MRWQLGEEAMGTVELSAGKSTLPCITGGKAFQHCFGTWGGGENGGRLWWWGRVGRERETMTDHSEEHRSKEEGG